MAKKISVEVELDPSTHRWLNELAKANSHTEMNQRKVSAAELLAQAAFCMADYAGRREGSWEASAAQGLLMPSGFQAMIPESKRSWILDREEASRRKGAV